MVFMNKATTTVVSIRGNETHLISSSQIRLDQGQQTQLDTTSVEKWIEISQ